MVTCIYYRSPICSKKWRTSLTANTFGTVNCTASYNTIQWVRYLICIVLYCYLHSDLPGVEVVASTCVIVTNSPQTFHWVGYGLKLTIPQGSLPAGVDQCQLDIKASVAGQYQFPDNLQLVSGVFWVHPLPFCRFQKQLRVEIQHCTKMTSSTKLSFVRAHCSQESLPYTFKQLEGRGSFTEHSSYGLIWITSSSFCIGHQEACWSVQAWTKNSVLPFERWDYKQTQEICPKTIPPSQASGCKRSLQHHHY